MSYTIFTSNPTSLIAQAGRVVATFPSGIVRVDQTYLGLTSQSAAHRAVLEIGNHMPDGDNYPSVNWPNHDGPSSLKIFPEVSEKRHEDGFTEYAVSAYGVTKAAGFTSSGFSIEKYSQTFSIDQEEGAAPLQYTVTEFWELETRTYTNPVPSLSVLEGFPTAPENLFRRLRSRKITGNAQGNVELDLNWSVVFLSLNRINFGHIDELTITFGSEAAI